MSDMEYKEMAKVMTDEEVKTCMAILVEDSVILDIERNTIQNYIRVKYRLIGDHSKGIYWISLLSNSIEDVEEKHLDMKQGICICSIWLQGDIVITGRGICLWKSK